MKEEEDERPKASGTRLAEGYGWAGMSGEPRTSQPAALKVLIVTEAIFALIGLISGYGMLSDPSGEGMGLPEDLLDDAPIGDYTLVGLFFVGFYGVLPSVAAYGLWTKKRWRWTDPLNKWTGQHWAWTASAVLGCILLMWIAVEILILGPMTGIGGALQVIITLLGAFVLVLVTRPSVKASMRLN